LFGHEPSLPSFKKGHLSFMPCPLNMQVAVNITQPGQKTKTAWIDSGAMLNFSSSERTTRDDRDEEGCRDEPEADLGPTGHQAENQPRIRQDDGERCDRGGGHGGNECGAPAVGEANRRRRGASRY
jgi:hypothetical protein